MVKKINKKRKKEITLLIIATIQILLLISITPTSSHLIKQYDEPTENLIIKEKNNKGKIILRGLVNLLIGVLSIKQIGVVSAQTDTSVWYCCVDTCDPILSTDTNCNNIIPTSCDATDDCRKGCCFDTQNGLCTPSSPKGKCTSPGEWNPSVDCSINECRKGCCVLGSNVQFITERNCEFISSSQGYQKDFRQIWNELDCLALAATQEMGACVSGNNCYFITEDNCLNNIKGAFYKDYLCSHPDIAALGINCEKQKYIDCVDGKDEIYWFDSCDQRENIYSSDKTASWNNGMVLTKELSCGANSENGNIDSTTCGNCWRPLSKCSEIEATKTHIQDGNFVCKDLSCKNAPANGPPGTIKDRINGEKWCLYDGFIGEGKDTAGSEHWLAFCNEGIVEIDPSDNPYRGDICQEQITTENGKTFSQASSTPNRATECIYHNPSADDLEGKSEDKINELMEEMKTDCNANKHCMIKNIDVDEYFKFDICVPRYPKGANLMDDGRDDNLCSLTSQSCTVYYKRNIVGVWKCKKNCDCETNEFAQQMNDLCISLGDCGTYVNYIGVGTDNIKIEGKKGKKIGADGKEIDERSTCEGLRKDTRDLGIGQKTHECEKMAVPAVSWQDYTNKATPVQNQHVEPQEIDPFLSSLTGKSSFEDFDASDWDKIMILVGSISGASGGIFSGLAWLFLVEGFGWRIIGARAVITLGRTASAFGAAMIGFAIGMAAGVVVAKIFGLTGGAAAMMVISGGLAGAGIGMIIIAGAGNAWNFIGLGALIIGGIAFIWTLITGWGEGETRIVKFSCMPWQAPTFSDFNTAQSNCRKCNEDPLRPCTEYRCSSLGQTCRILNPNEENPACESIIYENNPPVITPGEIITKEGIVTQEYEFTNQQSKSVEIKSTTRIDGCIQEFTSVYFTLSTDEPAQCKYSFEVPPATYGEMEENYPFEQNAFSKTHTFEIWMPSLDSSSVYGVTGDYGNMNMYVRCKDYWNNPNIDPYIVKFCINQEPDGTAVNHALTTANPRNGAILKYGTTESPLTIWINEPAECKYDVRSNINYDDMSYIMTCKTGVGDKEFFGWPCRATLSNLVPGQNKFYIKCKDKPWVVTPENITTYGERNINQDDFPYTIYVSQSELKIDSITFSAIVSGKTVKINSGETIKSGFEPISVDMEVKTSGGGYNGGAYCEWGVLQDGSRWPFFDTFSNVHTQLLNDRMRGTYNIYIECTDDAENEVEATGQFTIFVDSEPPQIIRAFKDGGNLKVITNELARCYYSLKSCSFNFNDQGVFNMTTAFSTEHITDWNPGQKYYIRCEDIWNNPNVGCAIRISPSYLI